MVNDPGQHSTQISGAGKSTEKISGRRLKIAFVESTRFFKTQEQYPNSSVQSLYPECDFVTFPYTPEEQPYKLGQADQRLKPDAALKDIADQISNPEHKFDAVLTGQGANTYGIKLTRLLQARTTIPIAIQSMDTSPAEDDLAKKAGAIGHFSRSEIAPDHPGSAMVALKRAALERDAGKQLGED